jgi:hypothetical protein
MTWTKVELAYLAGIIDGEGTIQIEIYCNRRDRPNAHCFTSRLSVINTNVDIIKWIKDKFGGSTYMRKTKFKETRKDTYVWHIHADGMLSILKGILPYLIIKKQHALLVIEFRSTYPKDRIYGPNREIPQEIKDKRFNLMHSLKLLNKTGPKK